MERDICEFDQSDAYFEVLRPKRTSRIKKFVSKQTRSEKAIYEHCADLPRNMVRQLLSELVRDKVLLATERENTWSFEIIRRQRKNETR
jgi:hypothetical protein